MLHSHKDTQFGLLSFNFLKFTKMGNGASGTGQVSKEVSALDFCDFAVDILQTHPGIRLPTI